ncbi:hypothetical protein CTEN210_12833 [Chaetoceros tenuissimus]|uniref:Uncharacterized protein n=1 Tax=Chaetoceros tenuissimus TaxID=426638 RepID=A0AAD3HA89_9STRA|nr:hypothetical protein CTEN210_12833 [Chaetoceros tenuissimus]
MSSYKQQQAFIERHHYQNHSRHPSQQEGYGDHGDSNRNEHDVIGRDHRNNMVKNQNEDELQLQFEEQESWTATERSATTSSIHRDANTAVKYARASASASASIPSTTDMQQIYNHQPYSSHVTSTTTAMRKQDATPQQQQPSNRTLTTHATSEIEDGSSDQTLTSEESNAQDAMANLSIQETTRKSPQSIKQLKRVEKDAAKTAAIYYSECYMKGVNLNHADKAARETHERYKKWWLQKEDKPISFGDALKVPRYNDDERVDEVKNKNKEGVVSPLGRHLKNAKSEATINHQQQEQQEQEELRRQQDRKLPANTYYAVERTDLDFELDSPIFQKEIGGQATLMAAATREQLDQSSYTHSSPVRKESSASSNHPNEQASSISSTHAISMSAARNFDRSCGVANPAPDEYSTPKGVYCSPSTLTAPQSSPVLDKDAILTPSSSSRSIFTTDYLLSPSRNKRQKLHDESKPSPQEQELETEAAKPKAIYPVKAPHASLFETNATEKQTSSEPQPFEQSKSQPIERRFSSDETVAASNQSYDKNRTVYMDMHQNPLNGFVSENESITGTGIDPYATTDDEAAEAVQPPLTPRVETPFERQRRKRLERQRRGSLYSDYDELGSSSKYSNSCRGRSDSAYSSYRKDSIALGPVTNDVIYEESETYDAYMTSLEHPLDRTAKHIENAKLELIRSLAISGGDVTNESFLFALNQLRTLYNMTCFDARYGRGSQHDQGLEGNWLTISRPHYTECLGTNANGDFMYTLGRMSFDMFAPGNLVCSISGIFNSIRKEESAHCMKTSIPKSLRDEVEKGKSILRSYDIVTAFKIEPDSPSFASSSPNRNVHKPLKGTITTYGHILPDPKKPNRLSIWFSGGKIEPNVDQSDFILWKRVFGVGAMRRQLQEKARVLAAKLLLGATVPSKMEDDGTMEFELTRPIGGHGTAYTDVLFLDKSLRIVQGHRGSLFVMTRVH